VTSAKTPKLSRDHKFVVGACVLLLAALLAVAVMISQAHRHTQTADALRRHYSRSVGSDQLLDCFVDHAMARLSDSQLERIIAGTPSDDDNLALSAAVVSCQGPPLSATRLVMPQLA